MLRRVRSLYTGILGQASDAEGARQGHGLVRAGCAETTSGAGKRSGVRPAFGRAKNALPFITVLAVAVP